MMNRCLHWGEDSRHTWKNNSLLRYNKMSKKCSKNAKKRLGLRMQIFLLKSSYLSRNLRISRIQSTSIRERDLWIRKRLISTGLHMRNNRSNLKLIRPLMVVEYKAHCFLLCRISGPYFLPLGTFYRLLSLIDKVVNMQRSWQPIRQQRQMRNSESLLAENSKSISKRLESLITDWIISSWMSL